MKLNVPQIPESLKVEIEGVTQAQIDKVVAEMRTDDSYTQEDFDSAKSQSGWGAPHDAKMAHFGLGAHFSNKVAACGSWMPDEEWGSGSNFGKLFTKNVDHLPRCPICNRLVAAGINYYNKYAFYKAKVVVK